MGERECIDLEPNGRFFYSVSMAATDQRPLALCECSPRCLVAGASV